jgi:hypothetical protein
MPTINIDMNAFDALQRYKLELATHVGSAIGISMNSAVHHLLSTVGVVTPPRAERVGPGSLISNETTTETIEGNPAQFVSQRCSLDSQYRTSAKDLYTYFQEWCNESEAYCPSQRRFGMQLTAMGLQRKRRSGGTHWWEGIQVSHVPASGHMKQQRFKRLFNRVFMDQANQPIYIPLIDVVNQVGNDFSVLVPEEFGKLFDTKEWVESVQPVSRMLDRRMHTLHEKVILELTRKLRADHPNANVQPNSAHRKEHHKVPDMPVDYYPDVVDFTNKIAYEVHVHRRRADEKWSKLPGDWRGVNVFTVYNGEPTHLRETGFGELRYTGQFGEGFKSTTPVGRPESSDEVIQNLLDGLFSGALDRGIDLQLSRDGSGRWISFPDNFMSILLQPRNRALLVTVYGNPESFNDLGRTLQMKADRAPYSRFHIRSTQDLPTAVDIIETSLKLRSEKVHGSAPRFEPMRTIDVQPFRLTSSFLAMPASMDVTSLIGQQIRSQGAKRCLIVVSNNAIAEEMRARLFGRFSLSFRVLDSAGDVRGGRFLPAEPPKSLFIATHALFKELRSADSPQSRQETSWDMVAIDGIPELLKDELWWHTDGRDLLKSRGFTRHLSIISPPAIFKQPEILETIHDLLDQRPLPYWYEACEPWDTFKDTASIEEFVATLPMEEHARISDSTSFLERTYFTQAITQTIRDVVGRMNGEDSPSVVRVGGHFGSGKTHTLMTLYHLVNNPDEANRNVNVQDALQGLNVPDDARAFFINGAEIGTTPVIAGLPPLWSELARQVDLNLFTSLIENPGGTHRPPNTALYQRILEAASPGVILVDETEAYIRTVNASSEERHSQLSAQSLNDLIRLSYSVVGITVVFTNSETEDEYFDRSRLEMALELDERLTATRTPVDDDEILEVVKKRIFKEIDQETGNEVAAAYHRLYMSAPDQFDILVSNPPYTDRLANAYPFHPQLIDLLSTDLQDSGPSSKPGLRRLLQTLAGIVADQWGNRQSAYSIQPSHLPLGGGWVRTLLTQNERSEDRQHRLAALDHMRERLTKEVIRADQQGRSGTRTYNHDPVLRSVSNAVFAETLRPGPTTPSHICLAVADPDIRPEHIHEALSAPAFRLLLGPPPNPDSNIMHLYQVDPNPLLTSEFLTEVTMPPANRAEALDFLVRMNLEPFWDGGHPSFRKIAGRRGYNVTRQSREQTWPKLIELLELDTKVDSDGIRKEVKRRLGI